MRTITEVATIYKLNYNSLAALTANTNIGGEMKIILNFAGFLKNIESNLKDIELKPHEFCSACLGFAAYYRKFMMRYYKCKPDVIMTGFYGRQCTDEKLEEYINQEAEDLRLISRYLPGVYAIDIGDIDPMFSLQTLLASLKFDQDTTFVLGLANPADILSICKTTMNIIGISLLGKHTSLMNRDTLSEIMEYFATPEQVMSMIGFRDVIGVKGFGEKKTIKLAQQAYMKNIPFEDYIKSMLPKESLEVYFANKDFFSFRKHYNPTPEYKIKLSEQFVNLYDRKSLNDLNFKYFSTFPIDLRVL